MSIRAIETEWNGYRFRSRLEARWAVFFDAIHVPYEYELEGFELDGLRYLPDFWMRTLDAWIEVKGQALTERDAEKARRLAVGSGKFVFVLFSELGPLEVSGSPDEAGRIIGSNQYFSPNGDWDGCQCWGECGTCGEFVVGHFGSHRVSYDGSDKNSCSGEPETDSPRLLRAYRAARQARFETYPKNMRKVLEDGRWIR